MNAVGKPDKIKRSVMYSSTDEGGLNMPNVQHQEYALKIAWVKRLCSEEVPQSWQSLVKSQLPNQWKVILDGNISEKDLKLANLLPRNSFWQHVLLNWSRLTHSEPKRKADVLDQSLSYNSFIKLGNQVVFNKALHDANIRHIKDILNDEGQFMSYREFQQKHGARINFVEYYGMVSAILKKWKGIISGTVNVDNGLEYTHGFKILPKLVEAEKTTKTIYKLFSSQFAQFPTPLMQNWGNELGCEINKDIISSALRKINK